MNLKELLTVNNIWFAVGFLGQFLFSMRFIIQWLKSEYQKKSVIPLEFWYFSIFGGLVLLTYAIHRRDPVFILGQGLGLFVYVRNLYLIRHEKKQITVTLEKQ